MRQKDSVISSLGAQARRACTLDSSQNSLSTSGLGEIKFTSELIAVTSVFVVELEPQWVLSQPGRYSQSSQRVGALQDCESGVCIKIQRLA